MSADLIPTAREEVEGHLAHITDLAARYRSTVAIYAARIAELEQGLAALGDLADDYRAALTVLPDRSRPDGLTAADLADLAALGLPDPRTDAA